MDRGAWWATVHGIARVGRNLVLSFLKQIKVRGNICHTERGIIRDEQALLRVSGTEN